MKNQGIKELELEDVREIINYQSIAQIKNTKKMKQL